MRRMGLGLLAAMAALAMGLAACGQTKPSPEPTTGLQGLGAGWRITPGASS